MKSRIPVDERALYFHAGEDDGELAAIEAALGGIQIPVRRLTAACLDSELAALAASDAKLPENGPAKPEDAWPDALIFKSLTRARLDEALCALNRAQAGQGMLKAVLTEYNRCWRLRALIGELEKEDALMNAYGQLQALVRRTLPRFEQHPDEALAAALERAQAALEGSAPSLSALQAAKRELEGLLAG